MILHQKKIPNGLFFLFIICFLLHFINSAELLCVLTWTDTTQPQTTFLISGPFISLIVNFPEKSFHWSFTDLIEIAI